IGDRVQQIGRYIVADDGVAQPAQGGGRSHTRDHGEIAPQTISHSQKLPVPLEPTPAQMQDIGEEVLEFVRRFIEARADARASDLGHNVRRPKTDDVQGVLDYIGDAAARAVDAAGPGYLAYIPGGGLYTAALADFITAAVNRYTTVAALAPAFVALEETVIRWIADLFEFPQTARGILTTGGTLANFSALVTAREALGGGTVYVSDQ